MEKVKQPGRRSYGQFCAVARALDVVGDRWTLLIVRELLPRPKRFTEVMASLPGIATNLLSERLRTLTAASIVERRWADVGVVYALTPWGTELREPMEAIGRWGAPLLATGRNDDFFQPRSLELALPALLRGVTANPALELGLEINDSLTVLRVDSTGPQLNFQPDSAPATILTTTPEVVVGLAAGALTIDQALAEGQLIGDLDVLRKVFPSAPASAPDNLAE